MVRAAEKTYDARALEQRIAEFWEKHDAYHRTREHRAGAPAFYFLDGPPYATGHIHIGTARNKILKDVFVRHQRARGFAVRDQPGYDMHGLPIEVKVEKELGFTSKRDIEAHGIDRFVEACRTFAVDHLRMMNDEFKELGVWMDWDRPYMTVTNEYVEGAWWAIEKAHERGLLFESERVLTWCWRCQTALANAEIEFEEREDPSAYVKFPVEGKDEEFLVIWTTTPWTLPANVAIAANPDLDYVRLRVRKEGRAETLVVAAAQAENVARIGRYENAEIVSTFKGRELEGLRYEHPFRAEVQYHQVPASEWNNRVILGAHVAADRTGLVHTATGHGVEDFEVGRKYGVPVFSPVGEDGRYTEQAGDLAGLAVKSAEGESEADAEVLRLLRMRGLLLASRNEKHAYAHCWRCKNPIVFRATKQWFIDVPKVKERMVEEVKRVEWTPEWAGSARQLDWVENAREWCISRQRYWGIPLPVWTCSAHNCDEKVVIGSRRELLHVSDYREGTDLHRPWIDRVRVACPRRGCGGVMKRVPDVLDVWFDSAVAAWASLEWPSRKDEFESLFPARWICEGLDQTRGWFYSQLAAGVAALDQVPYEKVVMHGWVHDAQGRPMSKSLGNIVQPKDVIAKFGADAFRVGVVSGAAPWEDVSFGEDTVRAAQRTLNILWNVHVFATQYMHADGYEPVPLADALAHGTAEDRWLTSRLQTAIAETTRHLETYDFHKAAREVEAFVLEDLSRWYVRLVRDRVWGEADSDDKRACYAVLHESLLAVARLLAPFAPHAAEAIYQDLTAPSGRGRASAGAEALTEGSRLLSVHMEDWPVADGALTDYELERDMSVVRSAVEAAAYARQKANMKLRWPVAKLVFASDDPEVRSALARFRDVVLEQANAKDVELVTGEWERLHLAAVPNKGFIGKTFRQDAPRVVQGLQALDQPTLRDLRAALATGEARTLDLDGVAVQVTPDLLSFETTLPEHVSGADFDGGSVYVDTEVTEELKAEGAARDLARRVQEMRKALGLPMDAVILVEVGAPDEFQRLVQARLGEVAEATRATMLVFVADPAGEEVRAWDLEGTSLTIGVRRAGEASTLVAGAEETLSPPDAPTEAVAPPPPEAEAAPAPAPRKASAKKAAPRKAAKKAAPRKAASKAAKKAVPKKPAAKKAKAPAKKTTAKKTPAKKGAAKKAGAKKVAKKGAKKGRK